MSSSSPQAVLLYGANYRNRTNNLLITNQLRCQLRQIGIWWTVSGSNRWPPACRAGVLPAELTAHMADMEGIEPSTNDRQSIMITFSPHIQINFMSSSCIIPPQRFFYVDIQCILGDSIPALTLQGRHSDQNSLIAVSVATPTFN